MTDRSTRARQSIRYLAGVQIVAALLVGVPLAYGTLTGPGLWSYPGALTMLFALIAVAAARISWLSRRGAVQRVTAR